MKGTLKAISIQDYGLFNEKGKVFFRFQILDPRIRVKIDPLQGRVVDFDEQIKPILETKLKAEKKPEVKHK